MGNIVLIGGPSSNVVAGGTVTEWSTYGADFAGSLVANTEPSETWRSLNRRPKNCGLNIKLRRPFNNANVEGSYIVDSVGLANLNLHPESGLYRVIGSTASITSDPRERVVPNALVDTTNTTGTVGDIDEDGDTPDEAQVSNTGAGSMEFTVRFATPSAAPVAGSHRQIFAALISTQIPLDVTCILEETGALREQIGTKKLQGLGYCWFFWTWDAAQLVTTDGSAVEARFLVDGCQNAGDFLLEAIEWTCEVAADFGATATWDSGWLEYTELSSSGLIFADESGPQKCASYLTSLAAMSSPYYISDLIVMFMDDWTPNDISYSASFLPDISQNKYVELGSVFGSKGWSPAINFNWGEYLGSVHLSTVGETEYGNEFGQLLGVKRLLRVPLDYLTTEESHLVFDRIVLRKSFLRKFFVVAIPDDPIERVNTQFPCRLANAAALNAEAADTYGRGLALELMEVR